MSYAALSLEVSSSGGNTVLRKSIQYNVIIIVTGHTRLIQSSFFSRRNSIFGCKRLWGNIHLAKFVSPEEKPLIGGLPTCIGHHLVVTHFINTVCTVMVTVGHYKYPENGFIHLCSGMKTPCINLQEDLWKSLISWLTFL